ncbi:MAG: enoyl-CoA hydratase-related protein [Acidimicrobiales bacterium]
MELALDTVRTTLADRVAVVTLDDAERRNAITPAMVGDLASTFEWLEHEEDDCGAVVLTGAPPAFCAGADLSQLQSGSQAGLREIYEAFLRIARSPLPTIAAVNGAAVGAGVNMALCCDVILAAASARIDTRFLKLGIHPGGGHTWMLRRRVGPQAAAALVLFGEVLDGAEAERIGLAWRCVADDELLATAATMAGRAAAAPLELAHRAKHTIDDMALIPTHEDAVDHELVAQVWSMDLPGYRERLASARAAIGDTR